MKDLPRDEVHLKAQARKLVFEHIKQTSRLTDFTMDDIYTVAFMRVLQNWRAVISTTFQGGVYYEVTYNGDMAETILVLYKELYTLHIPDRS